MASTRLPGKVLLPLCGRPVLARLIERARRARMIDGIVVATTSSPEDDAICELATAEGVDWSRGSMDDVMGRVLDAARAADADAIVELTGDNPLVDPAIIDLAVASFLASGADYMSNVLDRTFPIGLDVQVFRTATLGDAAARTQDPDDREHVSLYIYRNPDRYRIAHFRSLDPRPQSHLRLTLDTAEDLAVISAIFDALLPSNPAFDTAAVLDLLDRNPAIAQANAAVVHRWVTR
jgi:spore coat polysaccharide biosynthesis protein SpsF